MTRTEIETYIAKLVKLCNERSGSAEIEESLGTFRASFNPASDSRGSQVYSEWYEKGIFLSIGSDGRFELDTGSTSDAEVAVQICAAVMTGGYKRTRWFRRGKVLGTEIVVESDEGKWISSDVGLFKFASRRQDDTVGPY